MKHILPRLKKLTPRELHQLSKHIIGEFSARGMLRSGNNPIGDYTEWLVADRLKLKLAPKSATGYDCFDNKSGIKYEVKARRVTKANPSRQLSAIRGLEKRHFDHLVAVIYSEDFEVILALKIPYKIVLKRATRTEHTNSHKLEAKDNLRLEKGVEDITQSMR